MSDVSRYLPLSQRRHEDESGVTGDWRAPFCATLLSLADTLETLTDGQWTLRTPVLDSAVQDVTVDDVIAELAARLTATRGDRVRAAVLRRPVPSTTASRPELVARLRGIAADDRKRRIGELSAVVVAALDVERALAAEREVHIVLDPKALGAVAVARSLDAPLPIRAVLGGVTLVAADGGWRVGRGAVREAAASDIVLFLFGRTGVPDSPAGPVAPGGV